MSVLALVLLAACVATTEPDDSAPDSVEERWEVSEISYDDGEPDGVAMPKEGVAGGMIAVRFTPPSWPAELQSVRWHVADHGVAESPFTLQVFLADGDCFLPGTELLPAGEVNASGAPDQWVTVDLSEQGLVLEEGCVYVAMKWLEIPGLGGEGAQALSFDSLSPEARSVVWLESEQQWSTLQDLQGVDVNVMARLTVRHRTN